MGAFHFSWKVDNPPAGCHFRYQNTRFLRNGWAPPRLGKVSDRSRGPQWLSAARVKSAIRRPRRSQTGLEQWIADDNALGYPENGRGLRSETSPNQASPGRFAGPEKRPGAAMALRHSSRNRDSATTPVTDRLGAVVGHPLSSARSLTAAGGFGRRPRPTRSPGRFAGGGIPRRVGGVPKAQNIMQRLVLSSCGQV